MACHALRFLTTYVYFPLGGNRKGLARTCANLMIVFLLQRRFGMARAGFLSCSGADARAASINSYRIFRKPYDGLHPALQWMINFGFIVVAWVFFRATSLADALAIVKGHADDELWAAARFHHLRVRPGGFHPDGNAVQMIWYAASLFACLGPRNTYEKTMDFRPTVCNSISTVLMILYCTLSLSSVSVFLYFNFLKRFPGARSAPLPLFPLFIGKVLMKRKTWALASLALLLAAIAAICLTVIVIDPFQVYRPATRYLPPIDRTTQVYANAGVARSYAYDSAIVGTFVTENFRPSQMDSLLGGRFIKLCTSAGTAYNHALLMDLAFRTHDMRRIVYGLDVYSFIARLDQTGSDVPLYLYDDSLLNDVSYWLNRSVLATFLPRCLSAWGQKQDDSIRDSMYCWAGQDEYGSVALYTARFTAPENPLPADAYIRQAQANLDAHLLLYVAAHPETQFDIFFPPYSAAEWATMESKGTLESMLALRSRLPRRAERLCERDDLRFHHARGLGARPEQLYDALHYGQWINDAITGMYCARRKRRADRETLDTATAQLRAWADAQIEAGG